MMEFPLVAPKFTLPEQQLDQLTSLVNTHHRPSRVLKFMMSMLQLMSLLVLPKQLESLKKVWPLSTIPVTITTMNWPFQPRLVQEFTRWLAGKWQQRKFDVIKSCDDQFAKFSYKSFSFNTLAWLTICTIVTFSTNITLTLNDPNPDLEKIKDWSP